MARNNDRDDSLPAFYPGNVTLEVSVVAEPKDISNSDDYQMAAFRVRANGRNYKEQQWVHWFEVHVRGTAAQHVLEAGFVKNDRLVVSGKLDANKWLPSDIREKDAEDDDWITGFIISVDNSGFCVPSNRFQAITIDEVEEEEDRSSRRSSKRSSSRSSGGSKSRGRRDDDEDEEEDEEEEEDKKPARRSSSRSSSKSSKSRGRDEEDDDDDSDDEEDEKPARRSTRTSRNSARSERRSSRTAKSHGDDEDDELDD